MIGTYGMTPPSRVNGDMVLVGIELFVVEIRIELERHGVTDASVPQILATAAQRSFVICL